MWSLVVAREELGQLDAVFAKTLVFEVPVVGVIGFVKLGYAPECAWDVPFLDLRHGQFLPAPSTVVSYPTNIIKYLVRF